MDNNIRIITAALPFVNNVPHLGNLAGSHLPADVFARHCRKTGYRTYFIGGSDEHGTATELAAHRAGTTAQELCDRFHRVHQSIYEWFDISYDIYSRTSGAAHQTEAREFFTRLYDKGLISPVDVLVASCRKCRRDLADRLIRGQCPKCGAPDANGDQCERCDSALEADELIAPRCVFCEQQSVEFRTATHLFFDVAPLEPRIEAWLKRNTRIDDRVRSEVLGWIAQGTKPRCISRRLSWGIPVPLPGFEDKVLYVWFENLIGYVSILKELLGAEGERLWREPSTRVFHFFGKDNVVFHGLYWPAELLGDGRYILPHDIVGLQHLTHEGAKFSKSKHIGIFGDEAARSGIPVDYWRFYLISTLPESRDSEFIESEFHSRVDSLLIGVFGNLVHRTLSLIWKQSAGRVGAVTNREPELESEVADLERKTLESYEACRFRDALEGALNVARIGNRHLAAREPWKTGDQDALIYALHWARVSAHLLEPIIPSSAKKVLELIGANESLDSVAYRVGAPQALFRKLTPGATRNA